MKSWCMINLFYTENDVLEVWDGTTFITAAGTSASIGASEMDDLILEYTLIFG